MGRYFWNAGATATMLHYDGSQHVEERAQGNNALLRRYIHGPGATRRWSGMRAAARRTNVMAAVLSPGQD
jgi:hypothetical protein